MAILITLIGFGIMVFLHELGHFMVAKKFGVLVHEFSIGMGPKIFSFGRGETKYSLRLIPIGGFVRLEGEGEESDDNDPRSFSNLKPLKRIAILVAGAAMNIILGWIIFTIININTGITPSVINDISTESGITQNILKPGDEIIRLDSTRIHTYDDVALFMSRTDGEEITVKYKRDGKTQSDTIKPCKTETGYKLGVIFASRECNYFEAARYAVYDTLYISKAVILAVSDLISGKESLDALSGPVEIVSVVDSVASQNNSYAFLSILILFAMITVNLGIFNLLPFPALDGGSIVFALYELIFKRKIKQEIVGYIGFIGFALLMLLAVYVTIGDIRALIN